MKPSPAQSAKNSPMGSARNSPQVSAKNSPQVSPPGSPQKPPKSSSSPPTEITSAGPGSLTLNQHVPKISDRTTESPFMSAKNSPALSLKGSPLHKAKVSPNVSATDNPQVRNYRFTMWNLHDYIQSFSFQLQLFWTKTFPLTIGISIFYETYLFERNSLLILGETEKPGKWRKALSSADLGSAPSTLPGSAQSIEPTWWIIWRKWWKTIAARIQKSTVTFP